MRKGHRCTSVCFKRLVGDVDKNVYHVYESDHTSLKTTFFKELPFYSRRTYD